MPYLSVLASNRPELFELLGTLAVEIAGPDAVLARDYNLRVSEQELDLAEAADADALARIAGVLRRDRTQAVLARPSHAPRTGPDDFTPEPEATRGITLDEVAQRYPNTFSMYLRLLGRMRLLGPGRQLRLVVRQHDSLKDLLSFAENEAWGYPEVDTAELFGHVAYFANDPTTLDRIHGPLAQALWLLCQANHMNVVQADQRVVNEQAALLGRKTI